MLKPSLQEHEGCDIIDICPGPGVWSSKLHEVLKPRNHILLEPDLKRFGEFLNPLVEQPNSSYRTVDYDWQALSTYERITQDVLQWPPIGPTDSRRRAENKSILVTACIGNWSVKKGMGFSSITKQLLIWFARCAASNELFHSHGPVRILCWLADEEKGAILPRSNSGRDKTSIVMDRLTNIVEVAGSGDESRGRGKSVTREPEFILQSAENVVARMSQSGLWTPEHRRTPFGQLALDTIAACNDSTPDEARKIREITLGSFGKGGITKEVLEEYRILSALEEKGNFSKKNRSEFATAQQKRLKQIKNIMQTRSGARKKAQPLMEMRRQIQTLEQIITSPTSSATEISDAKSKWMVLHKEYHDGVQCLKPAEAVQVLTRGIGHERGLAKDPPLLMWDRRPYEPLMVSEEEFMLRKPMALLDIQPKELPDDYSGQDHEYFEDILVPLFASGTDKSVKSILEGLAPGLSDRLIEKVPSLRDPMKGGTLDLEDMKSYSLTVEMIEELCVAWREFPWRPPGSDSSRYFRNRMATGYVVT